METSLCSSPSSAGNVALPTSVALHTVCATLRHGCCWMLGSNLILLLAGPTAANLPQQSAAGEWDRQMGRQTDRHIVQLHRPCSTYYMSSGNNQKQSAVQYISGMFASRLAWLVMVGFAQFRRLLQCSYRFMLLLFLKSQQRLLQTANIHTCMIHRCIWNSQWYLKHLHGAQLQISRFQ